VCGPYSTDRIHEKKPTRERCDQCVVFSWRLGYYMMRYKGYTGRVEYDDEARIFHGELIDTRDVVTFQGTTVDEIEQAFRDSVDDYLDFCRERGERPDKPFSGRFVLRIPSELHHKLYLKAAQSGKSLNNWIVDVLKSVARS
jgi:predicted HicB family RNase H-like nuclease